MSTLPTRIDLLSFENFRCFSELEVLLHPKLTVIVAKNGGGKTSVLDAAALFGWNLFLLGFEFKPHILVGMTLPNVRRIPTRDGAMIPIQPVRLSGLARVADKPVQWNLYYGRALTYSGETSVSQSVSETGSGADAESSDGPASTRYEIYHSGRALRLALQDYEQKKTDNRPTLPVLGYYGTGRLWAAQKMSETQRKAIKGDNSPTSGYDGCLSPNSHFSNFEVWFERYSREAQQENMTGNPSPHRPAEKLQAVVNAVDALLKPVEWHSLHFDFTDETIVAEHPVHGRLPVFMLSDGIRVVIGLVGDIAHRCARLNPHFGADAAKLTPGVIMIDEIDLHLHPAWQQIIVTALTEAFPQIQWILTTHSPQVLSTVKRESIRMLDQDAEGQWSANEPDEETQGVESSTAMNDVMGVQQIPPIDAAHWRHDYTALIEMGMHETKEGTDCRDKLRSHFGDQHPVMLDFDRLIRFQALKRRKSQPLE